MRKVLISVLLATTFATPALAQQQTSAEARAAAREARQAQHAEAREERSQAREERQQARSDRYESSQRSYAPRPVQVERQVNVYNRPATDLRMQRVQVNDGARAWQQQREQVVQQRRDARQDARELRQEQRQQVIEQRVDSRNNIVEANRLRRTAPPVNARPDRPAPPPETASHYGSAPTWHTSWRNDHRYDWRNYRHHHRSLFHLGLYLDPFGWGYQRWGIGWRLWPSYYSSSYWLDDPYMYRLPYAPWPYRWVRYYDDALLVNVYSGQVVDVMYDFFW